LINYYLIYLDNNNEYEEDYNSKIYKLHCSLKYKSEDIENTNDMHLVKIFNELLEIIYEILINNNVRLFLVFEILIKNRGNKIF